ncbi:MAG: thermonuclease family protein [Xanthobacteraceae bacterium]|nr:thermonuclease family protein [Xanthobacteraceae bacterium]
MRRSTINSVLVAAVLIAVALLAERFAGWLVPPVTGAMHVVDGDSFELGEERVRLDGIDAPELHQDCGPSSNGSGTKPWPCGRAARDALRKAAAKGAVSCRPIGTDVYGRSLSMCEAGGVDLARELVAQGLAVATGLAYARAQDEARRAKRGIWAGPFEQPASWRARNN